MAQMATPPHSAHVLAMIDALAEIERETHTPGLAALRQSGVPMNADESTPGEGEPAGEPAGGEGEPAGSAGESEPAGGDEPETFDRKYVESLRKENARYRQRAKVADDLEAAEQARKDAELGDLEREKKARQEAEERAERLEREALRAKVARKHGLDDELVEFVVGDDEAAMEAKAELLAAKTTAAPPKVPAVPGGPQGGGKDGGAITHARAVELMRTDPDKFNELYEAGQIPRSALAAPKK